MSKLWQPGPEKTFRMYCMQEEIQPIQQLFLKLLPMLQQSKTSPLCLRVFSSYREKCLAFVLRRYLIQATNKFFTQQQMRVSPGFTKATAMSFSFFIIFKLLFFGLVGRIRL
jgi:hypothetical protein